MLELDRVRVGIVFRVRVGIIFRVRVWFLFTIQWKGARGNISKNNIHSHPHPLLKRLRVWIVPLYINKSEIWDMVTI